MASRKKNGTDDDRKRSLGFEEKLWAAADLLHNNVDPAEHKNVVLGLLFLKYVSAAFSERQSELATAVLTKGSDNYVADTAKQEAELAKLLEDPDEYLAANVFWVPHAARWEQIQAKAKDPSIGKLVNAAMDAIEHHNPTLKGVLTKIYAKPDIDNPSLGKLIDLVSGVGLGTSEHRAKETVGRVYDYFQAQFASGEGRRGMKRGRMLTLILKARPTRWAEYLGYFTRALRNWLGYDVFVSYPRADAIAYAEALEQRLSGSFAVFRDETTLQSGDEFPKALVQGIRRAKVPVFLVTPAALESEWVQRELEARTRSWSIVRRGVLPILFPPLTIKSLPPRLAPLERYNFEVELEGANIDGSVSESVAGAIEGMVRKVRWQIGVQRLLILILLTVFGVAANDQLAPTHYRGEVPNTVLWWQTAIVHPSNSKSNQQIVVNCDVTVYPGGELRLQPGVQLAFGPDIGLMCEGTLEAQGEPDRPVRLTAAASTQSWAGMTLLGSATANLSFCDLTYAGGRRAFKPGYTTDLAGIDTRYLDGKTRGGAILAVGDVRLTLANCKVEDNSANHGAAVFAEATSVVIASCTFRNNRTHNSSDSGGGAVVLKHTFSRIEDTCFESNSVDAPYGAGGALYLLGRVETRLIHVHFVNNRAPQYGGAVYGLNVRRIDTMAPSGKRALIEFRHCVFRGNLTETSGGAAFLDEGLEVWLLDCIFEGNKCERPLSQAPFEGGDNIALYSVHADNRINLIADEAGLSLDAPSLHMNEHAQLRRQPKNPSLGK